MAPSERRVAAAFLPAVLIHGGLLAAVGLIFSLLPADRHEVLPVVLLNERPTPAPAHPEPEDPPGPPEPAPAPTPRPARPPARAPAPRSPADDPDHEPAAPAAEGSDEPSEPAEPAPAASHRPAFAVAATAPPAAHAAQDDGADPLDAIRELIESHLVYPPMARLQGIEGTVGVRFDVSAAGEPTGLAVVESSGFEILDEAALATVERAAPLPLVSPTVKVPVVFQLE